MQVNIQFAKPYTVGNICALQFQLNGLAFLHGDFSRLKRKSLRRHLDNLGIRRGKRRPRK